MIEFTGVQPADIERVWPYVETLIAEGCEQSGGRYWAEDIKGFLTESRMQLWVAHDGKTAHAVAVTEVLNYPRLKALNCALLAGKDPASWLGTVKNTLESYAAAHGCALTEIGGRKGWQRLLPDYRWTGITLEKRLCSQSPQP